MGLLFSARPRLASAIRAGPVDHPVIATLYPSAYRVNDLATLRVGMTITIQLLIRTSTGVNLHRDMLNIKTFAQHLLDR